MGSLYIKTGQYSRYVAQNYWTRPREENLHPEEIILKTSLSNEVTVPWIPSTQKKVSKTISPYPCHKRI